MSLIGKIIRKYNTLPLWAFNALAPFYYMLPKTIRYGKIYNEETRECKRISKLSSEELSVEKDAAIRRLVQYAYEHVPYYHELFDRIGLAPHEIKGEKDLCKIPCLTKQLLVENRDRLLSDEFDKASLIYLTTSGSTGTPTGFYVQKESPMREIVYCQHMLAPYGIRAGASRLVLRGKSFWAQRKGKYWQWDAFKRELSVDVFNMLPEHMEEYCKAIEKYKPEFAYGFPSAMYALCKYISLRDGGLKHQFKGYEAISESFTEEQKQFIERIIRAPMFSFYGMSERVIIATNVPGQEGYVVQQLYGVAELVNKEDQPINQSGVTGELVGTSLLNYAMPLIRYKMGDMASWLAWNERGERRLSAIQGRTRKDVLIDKEGNKVIYLSTMSAHSHINDYMLKYQYHQAEIGRVIVKVVPVPGRPLTPEICAEISKVLGEKVGGKIDFFVEEVEHLELNKNGKFSIVQQQLDLSKYE